MIKTTMTPVKTRWSLFDWPIWARWSVTLPFLTLFNWMLLAPGGVFKKVHVFLAHQDKIAHVAIFLALAMLVRWSVPGEYGRGWLRVAVITVVLIYTGSIEFTQLLLKKAGRSFEWLDMACNYAGVTAGWLLCGRTVLSSSDQDVTDPGRPCSSEKGMGLSKRGLIFIP